jgi:hypothetical protein
MWFYIKQKYYNIEVIYIAYIAYIIYIGNKDIIIKLKKNKNILIKMIIYD